MDLGGPRDLSKKLTRSENSDISQYGFNYPFSSTSWFYHSAWAWGADFFEKAFAKATIDTPQFLAASQFAVDMVAKQRVAGGGSFPLAKLAITIDSGGSVRTWEDPAARPTPFRIEHTMLPNGPGGRAVAMANACTYITQGSKAPEAAWLFYKHLLGPHVEPQIALLGGGWYTASKKIKPTTTVQYEDPAVYAASASISLVAPLIVRQPDLDKEWTTGWNDMIGGQPRRARRPHSVPGAGHPVAQRGRPPLLRLDPASSRHGTLTAGAIACDGVDHQRRSGRLRSPRSWPRAPRATSVQVKHPQDRGAGHTNAGNALGQECHPMYVVDIHAHTWKAFYGFWGGMATADGPRGNVHFRKPARPLSPRLRPAEEGDRAVALT